VSAAPIDWKSLLAAEVARSSKADVARRIGCSRSAISMVLRGTYPADPARIVARVVELLSRVHCPHLERAIAPTDCRTYALGAPPISSTVAADHWRACQRCAHRPADPPAVRKEPRR
jgi:hypothetical protein